MATPSEPDDPIAADRASSWGLVDDPALVAEGSDAEPADRSTLSTLLALVDDAASRVIDHPIRPRVRATPQGLVRGELDLLQVEVPAVLAAGLVLDRVVVRAEHVRVVPGLPPRVRAAPVSLRAYVSQANVDRWTHTAHLPIRLLLTEEGVVATTGVRGIRVSETLADLEVSGPFLRLAPKRMTIAGLPTPMVRFIRGYLPLPPLPKGARISQVRPGDGRLAVTFALEEVDEPLTPDIARRLRSLTRLPIPGLG